MDPITGLISAVAGGVSAVAGVWGLRVQLRRISVFRELRDDLERVRKWKSWKKAGKESQLLDIMERASIVIGPLQRRLVERFILLLLVIFSFCIGIMVDLPGELLGFRRLEPVDIILVVFQVVAGVVNRTPFLLDRDSKQFLEILVVINSRFYRVFVVPAMREFNREVLGIGWLQEERRREARDAERLKKFVHDEVVRALEERQTG